MNTKEPQVTFSPVLATTPSATQNWPPLVITDEKFGISVRIEAFLLF